MAFRQGVADELLIPGQSCRWLTVPIISLRKVSDIGCIWERGDRRPVFVIRWSDK